MSKITGGKAHGRRGPKTSFFMLPFTTRVAGFASTLTCKFAQVGVWDILFFFYLPSIKVLYLLKKNIHYICLKFFSLNFLILLQCSIYLRRFDKK